MPPKTRRTILLNAAQQAQHNRVTCMKILNLTQDPLDNVNKNLLKDSIETNMLLVMAFGYNIFPISSALLDKILPLYENDAELGDDKIFARFFLCRTIASSIQTNSATKPVKSIKVLKALLRKTLATEGYLEATFEMKHQYTRDRLSRTRDERFVRAGEKIEAWVKKHGIILDKFTAPLHIPFETYLKSVTDHIYKRVGLKTPRPWQQNFFQAIYSLRFNKATESLHNANERALRRGKNCSDMEKEYNDIAKETARSRDRPIWPDLDKEEDNSDMDTSDPENEEETQTDVTKGKTIFDVIKSDEDTPEDDETQTTVERPATLDLSDDKQSKGPKRTPMVDTTKTDHKHTEEPKKKILTWPSLEYGARHFQINVGDNVMDIMSLIPKKREPNPQQRITVKNKHNTDARFEQRHRPALSRPSTETLMKNRHETDTRLEQHYSQPLGTSLLRNSHENNTQFERRHSRTISRSGKKTLLKYKPKDNARFEQHRSRSISLEDEPRDDTQFERHHNRTRSRSSREITLKDNLETMLDLSDDWTKY